MLVILLPVILIGGILLKTWNVINGNKTGKWYGGFGNSEHNNTDTRQSASNKSYSANSNFSYSGGKQQERNASQGRIFRDDEGEYVDFQEIDK